MAVIMPFRGVRYNPARFEDLRVVVSQPYDRISRELQAAYRALSEYNIVRIIRGHLEDERVPDSLDAPAVYARARANYQQWLNEGVLIREGQPALYAYEQCFTLGGRSHARLGLIAAVALSDFSEGIVLPHERTHSGPKVDRLRLLSALQVNPEQIFMLYPDPENQVNALLRRAIACRAPDIDVVETYESAVQQRVWVITDPAIIGAIQACMAPKRPLIIADGHHRYETALTYRDIQRATYPDAPVNAAFNTLPATLVSMDDPGLVILPTHREIRHFTATSPATILARAGQHFHVQPAADLEACLAAVNRDPSGHAFGFYGGPGVGFHVLALRNATLADRLITDDRSREWKSLSVSILHKILLEQIAGVPTQGIEDKTMVRYHRHAQEAVHNVARGEGNFAFFVSPTRMAQIRVCAAQGEKMPQKSTDFYPKMISGLTMMPIGPDERLDEAAQSEALPDAIASGVAT